MTDLFAALYTYRPRVEEGVRRDRSPQEDWLTECFAASLRALGRLSHQRISTVLADLSGLSPRDVLAGLEGRRLEIATQVTGTDGTRPDMVLLLNGTPWIVAEHKVAHDATFSQLAGYARWLQSVRSEVQSPSGPELPAAAIAFCHALHPPPGRVQEHLAGLRRPVARFDVMGPTGATDAGGNA